MQPRDQLLGRLFLAELLAAAPLLDAMDEWLETSPFTRVEPSLFPFEVWPSQENLFSLQVLEDKLFQTVANKISNL